MIELMTSHVLGARKAFSHQGEELWRFLSCMEVLYGNLRGLLSDECTNKHLVNVRALWFSR